MGRSSVASNGTIDAMRTTIDSAGRIVIPRDIRSSIGLEPGTVVEVEIRDGVVSIEPVPAPVRIVKRGKLHVAMAEPGQPLTAEVVRSVREDIRNKR